MSAELSGQQGSSFFSDCVVVVTGGDTTAPEIDAGLAFDKIDDDCNIDDDFPGTGSCAPSAWIACNALDAS